MHQLYSEFKEIQFFFYKLDDLFSEINGKRKTQFAYRIEKLITILELIKCHKIIILEKKYSKMENIKA